MTGYQSKKDMAQAKLDEDDDDTQVYGDALTIAYQSGYHDGKKAAQPAQEPVGKFAKFTNGIWREVTDGSPGVPLYTAPQRPWVGLTDEDCTGMSAGDKVVAMWADRTLKEKNT